MDDVEYPQIRVPAHTHSKVDIYDLVSGKPIIVTDNGTGYLGDFQNTTNDALFRVRATSGAGKGVFFRIENTLDDYRTYEGYGPNFGWIFGQNGNSSPSLYVETLGSGRGVERAVRWGYDLTMQIYGAFRPAAVALTDAATITVDASKGNQFNVTLGGNRTMDAPTGSPTDGQRIVFRIKQDATGSRTLAWNAIYRFSTDLTSPTLTTTASKTDYLEFVYNAADTKWDIARITKGY